MWGGVASSVDGTKLVAVAGRDPGQRPGLIYISTNSGATWSRTSAPSNYWGSVASSADGSKLVAAWGYPGLVYRSVDSGLTWAATGAASNYWKLIASSADGAKLVAVANDLIYTSADGGTTWTLTGAPATSWSSVASSADGNKLVAVAGGYQVVGSIYTSTNAGASWSSNSAPRLSWTCVASSADGSKLAAGVVGGLIYTWQAMPELQLRHSGGEGIVSWPAWSSTAGCVLRQNSDLTTMNWTDATNPPTLNPATLEYEVMVPLSGRHQFYRLARHSY
jgi:hypothetical protein